MMRVLSNVEEIAERVLATGITNMTAEEYITLLDAIIDGRFSDDTVRQRVQCVLNDSAPQALHQRYYERQVASPSLLPPLLPWFIKR